MSSLHSIGIVALVDLAHEEPPIPTARDLVYLRVPIVDGSGNPPWLLRMAVESVARLVRDGVPTLVSCGAGMSRSPAITAVSLALAEGRPIEECLAEVIEGGVRDISPALWRDVLTIGADPMTPRGSESDGPSTVPPPPR